MPLVHDLIKMSELFIVDEKKIISLDHFSLKSFAGISDPSIAGDFGEGGFL